ncbi:hypothetical protein [Bifidobacterium aerophilum]|uniref:Uncharacterized protein n=1 Tax=Bifidobacterium aerophilum TaxID=1798155 RepID=A0A6N9Z441_9BIFI|nr:hypothetical protein [Bifidobacterium aerophilum]NEG89358.1 hypothetical protein [Bifidobacterium aerophilum]
MFTTEATAIVLSVARTALSILSIVINVGSRNDKGKRAKTRNIHRYAIRDHHIAPHIAIQ